jgi:FkbM family methyltransferase
MGTCGDSPCSPNIVIKDIASHEDFVNRVLRAVLVSADCFGEDNIDTLYPADGYVPSAADPLDKRLAYLNFFLRKSARLYRAFARLADDASKELFLSLILFRILGYRRMRLPMDHTTYFRARNESNATPGSLSTTEPEAPLAGLHHFEFSRHGREFRIDCLHANLFFTFFMRQYYFERNGVAICPRTGDIAVDAGACFGDTALDFAATVGPEGHVYSFEVLQSHLDIVAFNLRQNPDIRNLTLLPYALGNRSTQGRQPVGRPDPGFVPAADAPFRSLDSLVWDGTIPRVDFLKMDIEGAEVAALEGGVSTIKRFRPRLAISIYHQVKDYYRVPEFIDNLRAGYRMYVANYTISDGETILYATAE